MTCRCCIKYNMIIVCIELRICNEVRKLTGFDTVDDPEMDEFILTKNYETKSDKEEEEPQIKF